MLTHAAIAVLFVLPVADEPEPEFTARVLRVLDGNRFRVRSGIKVVTVRLLGVAAPEGKQPFGIQAAERLDTLIARKSVRVVPVGTDSLKQIVANVYVDDELINQRMIADGFAWHHKKHGDDKTLAAAEESARKAKRGLFAADDAMPPSEWRKQEAIKAQTRRQAKALADAAETRAKTEAEAKEAAVEAARRREPPPERPYANAKITDEYDRFDRCRNVWLTMDLDPPDGFRSLRMAFLWRKDDDEKEPTALFGVFSRAKEWKFLKLHRMTFLVDDKPFGKAEGRHDGDTEIVRGTFMLKESVFCTLKAADLKEIKTATKFECEIGLVILPIEFGHIKEIKKFVEYVEKPISSQK